MARFTPGVLAVNMLAWITRFFPNLLAGTLKHMCHFAVAVLHHFCEWLDASGWLSCWLSHSILFNYSRPGENFKLQHKWTDLINSRCWLFWRSDTTEVQRLPDWSQFKYPECFFQMVLLRVCRGDFAGAISLEHENASRRAQNIQNDIYLVFRQDHGGAGASSHLAKARRSKKTREKKTVQKKVYTPNFGCMGQDVVIYLGIWENCASNSNMDWSKVVTKLCLTFWNQHLASQLIQL